jgi:hypothetical protein
MWAAGLACFLASSPAFAANTAFYAGVQVDNSIATGLLGYQINKNYAVEAHVSRYETRIDQAGATSNTQITSAGMAALFMLPMKLAGGSPYFIFAKAGYERISKDVTYSFPASVTYSGSYNNLENRAIFGGGAQYDFYEHLSGRMGIDIIGQDRSVYLGAIFKF